MAFRNVYEDGRRARTYARLQFPGTYYLAFRDLPAIIFEYADEMRALDFGCGAGRSTRFLRELGFDAAGVDISADMIREAKSIDPAGDYRFDADGDLSGYPGEYYDLVLSAFTFDNIPTGEQKLAILTEIRRLLKPGGICVNLVSDPEIYRHEWASFSTQDFAENREAKTGDRVRIIITDTEDPRPVVDVVWEESAYRELYEQVGLNVVRMERPLGHENEPYPWVNETKIAPWVIYVLRREK